MITSWLTKSKVPGPSPLANLADFFAFVIELWNVLPISPFEDNGKITPRVIVNIVRITLKEMMQENIKRKLFSIL
jgi:hypothetical protein